MMSHIRILFAAVALGAAAVSPAAAAKAPVYTSLFSKVAVSGFDPVAYFTEGKPVEGSSAFSLTLNGVEYRFASAANRDAFKVKPARYAPQYGGYCAWAVSQGYTASADPKVWKIVNNKLYLNYNPEVGKKWAQDIPGNIRAADSNWPAVIAK